VQAQVSDRFGLTVTVCHDPTGCSKWIRLSIGCSVISVSIGLASPYARWGTRLGYIRGTTTTTGVEGHAFLQEGVYEAGQRVSDADMHRLQQERHALCPNWNYTIHPRRAEALDTSVDLTNRDVIF